MLHNQLSKPDRVWVTYDIDLIPATSPAAKSVKRAIPIWMDVQNGSVYPVFDVIQGTGKNGAYTYPDDAKNPYKGAPKNEWTSTYDGTLLATAGHVHPGGLHDDLWLQRGGAEGLTGHTKPGSADTAHLFSSIATYYEPTGGVSWDVSMSATPATLESRHPQGRRALDHHDLQLQGRLVVRVDGHHGRVDGSERHDGP